MVMFLEVYLSTDGYHEAKRERENRVASFIPINGKKSSNITISICCPVLVQAHPMDALHRTSSEILLKVKEFGNQAYMYVCVYVY